jgi:drug/metabolite transporter (DMT)-like permease
MPYVFIALLSAFLFGASTPIGKILLDSFPPFQLAGLLYLGAALGVLPFSVRKHNAIAIRHISLRHIGRKNVFRLLGAISLGGVAGPVLLLFGLQMASATSVAMWLNLELVATSILGYVLFRDYLGLYGWLGVIGTIIASALLSWNEGGVGLYALLLVGGASVCWGLDNHLTALIDGITPSQSTFWKGIGAGSTNLVIGFTAESFGSDFGMIITALAVGVFAYGFSISLYILAAQNLGATRSQMIFAGAPFFGVLLSVMLLNEQLSPLQIAAASILIVSLVILFRDRHSHYHVHKLLNHNHNHQHDDKHHDHDHADSGRANFHSHRHRHEPQSHSHPHWPDIHHRHDH